MWYDRSFAERYDATFARKVAPIVAERLVERMALRDGERILECACGTGACTLVLARTVGARSSLVACDRSHAMLEIAARKLRATTASGARPALSIQDMQSLGARSDSFDVVVSNLGLHAVADRDQAVREAARVLRAGGRAGYTVPGEWSLEPFQTWYWERVGLPDVRGALSVPVRAWNPAVASASLEADVASWGATLSKTGLQSVEVRVERLTVWFRNGEEFFEVGPFGHTRRALEALTDELARDTVRRHLTDRLDRSATPDGVPCRVSVLWLAGTKGPG